MENETQIKIREIERKILRREALIKKFENHIRDLEVKFAAAKSAGDNKKEQEIVLEINSEQRKIRTFTLEITVLKSKIFSLKEK